MTRIPIRWTPDDETAAILNALGRSREPIGSILRRALRLLAQADGILDPRGHIRNTTRPGTRPITNPAPRRPTP
jgi:hypothetical protein